MSPIVSILIPCFNSATFIEATLESAIAQSWPNTEIIVVDDGSTDDSVLRIQKFAMRGVKLLQQKNRGAAAARNHAFQCSVGDYIQFLDADDILSPNKIEAQLSRLMENPHAIASSEWGRFTDDISSYSPNPEPVWRDLPSLDWLAISQENGLGMMFPALWLIPRGLALRAGPWDETLSLFDDTEYFTRVLIAAEKVCFCENAIAYYRSGVQGSLSGQKTVSAWRSAFRVNELCESHLLRAEDSERMTRVVSLSWRHFAFSCYPHNQALAEEGLRRAARLSSAKMNLPSTGLFSIAARLLGWKTARRLQSWRHGGRV